MTAKKKPLGRANVSGVSQKTNKRGQFRAEDSASQAQRERILEALLRRPHSTEDLRKLGIFQVPARVKELRDRYGYCIETTRVTLVDREGYTHARAALYSLLTGSRGAV